ncbi:ImmA/IrrE family metallo-endopeptidase [Caenispirillum bisanense]|nr:ImmA/IrrE family metallo-endopeptidase [Caenispirillum bisanense]
MLRLARHLRGMQQVEASKRLGIDQSMLSRIENGIVDIRDDIVSRAASSYELPPSFFYLTEPVYGAPVSVHPMWRKKADVGVRELDCVIAELNVRVMHIRRLLEGADVAYSNELPRLDVEDYGDPAKIASIVRGHWRMPRGPIRNLTVYAEKAGVLVAHSALNGASISGVTFATPGVPPLIVLNSEQPADRMRFTLAHELGHLIMHRFPNPNMEEEANAFASALLLPNADIRPYFLGRKIDLALLASLKPEWQVSMGALLMAAANLGCLTANQKQYLWRQMSARGYRLREPPELDFPQEKPTVIPSLLKVHLEGLGYSTGELAGILHVNPSDLQSLYPVVNNVTSKERLRLTILK